MILKGYIFSILYVFLVVILAMLVSKLGVQKKYSRKLVHILVAFEWVILTYFFGAGSIHFLAVCLLFTLLLFIDYKMKLVPAMSSEGDNAPGTVYYGVAMSVMAVVTMFIPEMSYPFGIGVFCTSFGDGLAAVFGQSIKKHNKKIYGNKSLVGTLVNLIVCFLVPFLFCIIYGVELEIYHCILIAVFAAELELLTGLGLDNIILTVAVALLSYFLIYIPETMGYILPVILTPLIIMFALKKKALTFDGVILAVVLDLLISLSLGNFGFVILSSFFVISILIDKIKKRIMYRRNEGESDREKKGDCRDGVQVLANGLSAGVCALLYFYTKEFIFVIGFVASLAEALADTVASGVGVLSGRVFDIFRMRRCEAGESGGMSFIGTFSSLVAAFSLSFIAFSFGTLSIAETLLIALAAFLGGVFDSFLGSVLQVKYKCKVCGVIVEKETHCDTPTEKYRGVRFINNDAVNFAGTFFAALSAMLLYYLII